MLQLWGVFKNRAEQTKFSLLAVIFALTIGSYWTLRPIKDAVFLTVVGLNYQPIAKILSLFIMIPLIVFYSGLVDRYPRHRLLYLFASGYAVLTIFFAIAILNPSLGIANVDASPYRLLGWAWYLFVESFGSLMVALFWSFVSDTTTPESARRGYSLIAMGGQIGGVLGPVLGKKLINAYSTGYAVIFTVCCLMLLACMVYLFMKIIPKEQLSGFKGNVEKPVEGKRPQAGFGEGLRLLFSKPYLLGIFAVVSLYEIIVTVLDFHFKALAQAVYTGDALTSYMSEYAIWTNGIALICLLLGVGNIGRKLGLGKVLFLFPLSIAVAVIVLKFNPILSVAFFIMVASKGLNYALNQPAKEQLYIPTSKDSKYKAKAWIDMFGSRSSKGIGSLINLLRPVLGAHVFMWISSSIALVLVAMWMAIAKFLGKTHAQAVKEDRIVC